MARPAGQKIRASHISGTTSGQKLLASDVDGIAGSVPLGADY